MANNKSLKDAAGAAFTVKTTDTAGVNVPHNNIDTLPGSLVGIAIDTVAGAAAVGIPALAVRKDTGASLADTDGDIVGLQTNATGALRTSVDSITLPYAIGTAAGATDKGVPALAVRKDTAAVLTGVIDGDLSALAVDSAGKLHVNAGALPGGITGKATGVAFATSDVALTAGVVRKDTAAQVDANVADGDVTALIVDANGRLHANALVQGPTAADSAVAAAPVTVGARAATTNPTAVSDGDVVNLMATLGGKLVTQAFAPPELVSSGNPAAITDNAAHDILASPGASLKWYITSILVSNSHATENTLVTIQDEDNAVVWRGFAKCLGGGFSHDFSVPLAVPTAAKKLQAICATTGCSVYVNVVAFKAP